MHKIIYNIFFKNAQKSDVHIYSRADQNVISHCVELAYFESKFMKLGRFQLLKDVEKSSSEEKTVLI